MDSTVTNARPKQGGTAAVVLPVGRKNWLPKAYQAVGTAVSEAQKVFYKDDIGIAYAVNIILQFLTISSSLTSTYTQRNVEQEKIS